MIRRWFVCLLIGATVLAVRLGAVNYIAFEQVVTTDANIYRLTNSNIVAGSGHPQANNADCRVRLAELSYRIDGTAPSATVGRLAEPGDVITLNGPDTLLKFQFIRTTGTNTQIDCHEWN